jgi:hypothetical protein
MIAKLRTEKIFNFGRHDHVHLSGVRGTDRAPAPERRAAPGICGADQTRRRLVRRNAAGLRSVGDGRSSKTRATATLTPQDLFGDTGDASPTVGLRNRRLTLQRINTPVDQNPRAIASNMAAADARDPRKLFLGITDAVCDLALQPAHDFPVSVGTAHDAVI